MSLPTDPNATALGLDIGSKRIGVARANIGVRFASPLTTLQQPDDFIDAIIRLCRQESAALLVLGLPRGLDGQSTAQTAQVKQFAVEIEAGLKQVDLDIPLYWTDEALTSQRAETELRSRVKSGTASYDKAEVDALAATYILEDFLKERYV